MLNYKRLNSVRGREMFGMMLLLSLSGSFKKPLVIEVIGAGFDKPADARSFTLRFPRIQTHLNAIELYLAETTEFQDSAGLPLPTMAKARTAEILGHIRVNVIADHYDIPQLEELANTKTHHII